MSYALETRACNTVAPFKSESGIIESHDEHPDLNR